MSAPFDPLAERYDAEFTGSAIGRAQRNAVWRHLSRIPLSGASVLDLGCGTGEDAVWLAGRGAKVFAIDSSEEMIRVARRKTASAGLGEKISFLRMPIEELEERGPDLPGGPFDLALSNFAALDCVDDPALPGRALQLLIRPGGRVIAVVFAPLCIWEMVWYSARLDPRRAFRRLRGRGEASLGPSTFPVRYEGARGVARGLGEGFRLRERLGVGLLVPPSYTSGLFGQSPGIVRFLAEVERPFLRLAAPLADHLLLDFERLEGGGSG